MISDLKPYSKYKESGSRWLGYVPTHWGVHNLRTLIRRRNERNRIDLPLLSVAREKGVFVRSLTDDKENHNVIPEDLSNYKVARAGNLVINKMKAWQGSMGIAPCDGIVSPAYYVFDFDIANRSFGQVLLRSKPYVTHFAQVSDGVRIGQWDLTIAGMRQIPVLVPKEAEQAAIVRFLNWTNKCMNRTIQAKRKVIALLNEQKQIIIHRAVTRGLDLSVPLKPSGIRWLGEVPAHWVIVTLRRKLCSFDGIKIGPFGSQLKLDQMSETGYKVYGQANVIARDFARGKKFVDQKKFDALSVCALRPGDLVITMMGTSGRCARIPDTADAGIMDSHLLRLRLDASIDGNFAALVIDEAPYVKGQILMAGKGSIMQGLNSSMVKELILALPPLAEQTSILHFLNEATSSILETIDRTQREIELLHEYRTRLVADIVTGKLDVREAAAKLPEELKIDETEEVDEAEISDEEIAV